MSVLAASIEYILLVAAFEVFKVKDSETKQSKESSYQQQMQSLHNWIPLSEKEIGNIRKLINT